MNDTTELVYEPTSDRGHLTPAQIRRLLRPVRADRVDNKQGLAYVPQQEVRAELARIFGPGNVDHTMHKPELLWEKKQMGNNKGEHMEKEYWIACYMVGCTLRIRDYQGRPVAEFTEYHAEANSILPDRGEANSMAITSAQSYALRRAAISLGDAFGLHLYAGGSLAPLIGGTLQLDGDLDSPDADLNAPTNKRTLEIRETPGVNIATGEVPGEPAKSFVSTEGQQIAADQDAAAEAPQEPSAPLDVPSIDAAFKKPTTPRTRRTAPPRGDVAEASA